MKRLFGMLLSIMVIFTMSFGMVGSAYAASKTTHLEKPTMYVTLGGGITQHLLTASGKTIKASNITWTTSDKKIATVSKSGKVTGKKVTTSKTGPVTIKAKYKGKTYKCKAYVKYAKKEFSSISLKVGDNAKQIIYAASGNPASTSKVKFTVEKGKEGIATVDSEGLITAVSEGTVKIYAEYFGVKYSAIVTVSPKDEEKQEEKPQEEKPQSQQTTGGVPAPMPSGGGGGGGTVTPTPSGGGVGGTETPTSQTTKYTVSFDSNGGTGSMSSKEIEKDKSYKLPECNFTAPTGQKFKAWDINGSEKNPGDSIKITKKTTIKAVWKDVIYTVTFDSNGGTGSMNSEKKKYEESITLPECKFTAPTGQTFKAWDVDGSEKKVGESIKITKKTTVKAVWENIIYTVSFNANGGTGSMNSKEIEYGESITLPKCDFKAPSGKEFKAWKIEDKEYKVGESYTVKGDLTVNAVWQTIQPKALSDLTFDDYIDMKLQYSSDDEISKYMFTTYKGNRNAAAVWIDEMQNILKEKEKEGYVIGSDFS